VTIVEPSLQWQWQVGIHCSDFAGRLAALWFARGFSCVVVVVAVAVVFVVAVVVEVAVAVDNDSYRMQRR
jgi:hypothetical protein